MKRPDKRADLLKMLRGKREAIGLRVISIVTAVPNPVTFIFAGTSIAIDTGVFEIPVDFYPLKKGDSFLAFPLISTIAGQRWGLLQKINGGLVLGTMQSPTTAQLDGVDVIYGVGTLIVPNTAVMSLLNGHRVIVTPTWDAAAGIVKYVVLQRL